MGAKKKEIVIVRGDDWSGLYINGELMTEDHSLDAYDVLNVLGLKFTKVEPDDDWLGEVGRLPEKLSEVKVLPS